MPSALPNEPPALRSTWLRLVALPVRSAGTLATISAGISANVLPTPDAEQAGHDGDLPQRVVRGGERTAA